MTPFAAACRAIVDRGTKPALPEVRSLVDEFYAMPGNGAGGYALHCVLDDNNWERCFVESSIETARELGDVNAEWLARVLLLMSNSQRRKL